LFKITIMNKASKTDAGKGVMLPWRRLCLLPSSLIIVSIILLFVNVCHFCNAAKQLTPNNPECHNLRPIVGVLAQKCKGKRAQFGDQYFAASYVKWLESAGARVVPVKINQTEDYYNRLFQSLNGIIFPGGGQDLLHSGYANAARYFFRRSMAEFDSAADYFPIFGTCLGFEELLVLAGEERNLDRIHGTKAAALKTNFVPGVESRLLDSPHGLSDRTKATLTGENSTCHFHKYGIMKTTFENSNNITSLFKIVSTALDGNRDEFVDIMEGHKYPFYGTQFHPEKNAFEWKRRIASGLPHSSSSIRASQDIANFFVDEVRRNCHRGFASEEEEDAAIIYNYAVTELAQSLDSVFQQAYFFNVSDEKSENGGDAKGAANVEEGKRESGDAMQKREVLTNRGYGSGQVGLAQAMGPIILLYYVFSPPFAT